MHYLAVVIEIFTALLFAEITVRLALKYVFKYDSSLIFDPCVGWRLKPNLDGARKWTSEFSYRVYTDARGFRVPAGVTVRRDAPADIMILGDSFAFGEGVEAEQSIAGLLAHDFPTRRIVNTAVPNYGADQELLTLQNTTHLLAPGSVVLLFTYINDFDEILRKSAAGIPKPWCESKDSKLVVHEPCSFVDYLRGASILLRLGARVLHALGMGVPVEHVFDEAARLYRAVVLAMAATVRDAGARFFVVYTSGKEGGRACRATWGSFVGRCAREAGAEFVNLDENPDATSSPSAFFERDIHWTAAGTEINYRYMFARLFGPSVQARGPERPADTRMAS